MLTPEGYKSRLVEKQFDEYMQTFGAVCIEGPKYCGKTWTARSRAKSAAFVGNPENNFQTRTMAQISPDLVPESPRQTIISVSPYRSSISMQLFDARGCSLDMAIIF